MNFAVYLRKIPRISLIAALARKRNINVWLVGGFLRDTYLGRRKQLCDFDFCVEKNTLSVVKEFAKSISAKFIVLDDAQKSYRVILKKKNIVYTYDFSLMRAESFRDDLALRDFSINTLAVNLKGPRNKLIDYFGAREDIDSKLIRVIGNQVLRHDPLRILRAFSFAANYCFSIEHKTLDAIIKYRRLIKKVSSERINEELFKILGAESSFKTIKMMSDLKIIDEVIPCITRTRRVFQGAYHHLDVWEHSLETLRQFELLYSRKLKRNQEILAYILENVSSGHRRLQILKLSCILHDIGKPQARKRVKKKTIFHTHEKIGYALAEKFAIALRFSLREIDILKKLIFWHLRPGYLADQINPSKRAIYHFFRDTGEEGVAVILLSLSDWRATRGPLTNAQKRKRHEKIMFGLIDEYFLEKKKKPLPKIVDGHDIMRKFKIGSGPVIGVILKKIKEEQALGKLKNKSDAYRLAKAIIRKNETLK
jgi:poly(A) polymerase